MNTRHPIEPSLEVACIASVLVSSRVSNPMPREQASLNAKKHFCFKGGSVHGMQAKRYPQRKLQQKEKNSL